MFLNYREIAEQLGVEDMCNTLIRDMNEYGVCVLDNFLGHERGLQVLNEVTNMHSAGMFKVIIIIYYNVIHIIFPGHFEI